MTSTAARIALLASALAVLCHCPTFAFTPEELWRVWPETRVVRTPAPCLRPAELESALADLAARHPDTLQLAELGHSFRNRPIFLLTLGRGPEKILLWSQMHGDEPSATPALLDLVEYLLTRSEAPEVRSILDAVTLLVIPMLNPDGAEIYERRNAQGIDINRDALNLATPEGRLLKRVRDQHQPLLGFNLHDQNRRTAVGDTGRLATNAVLAVSGDQESTMTPQRMRAKRACAAIIETLAPFAPGGMARYDEDWSPRAFGDNLTAWGTAVVLIESGGLPPGRDLSELTRLNFVAILTVLRELARNDLADYDSEVYEALPRNESDAWSDLAVRGGFLQQPGTTTPYRADLSINLIRDDRLLAGCADGEPQLSRIVELGDSRFIAAGRAVDARDHLIVAPFEAGVAGWSARKWIDAEALSRLARSGVGSLHWQVKKRHLEAARAHAKKLASRDGARLEATAVGSRRPWLTLDGPPSQPASDSLRDVLLALAGDGMARALEREPLENVLQKLWPSAAQGAPGELAVSRGRAASFLLLSPAVEGRIDLDSARMTAVWSDGREIRPLP